MITKNFSVYLNGYEIKGEMEFEESELNKISEEDKQDYIYESICEYVKDNIEISIEE
ncbi:hypothetical protein [Clostridium botulinum]|uniref:DUF7167 family protein n=1 Tax=Clostridium botulinum TaxID=1491 RepID=UPI001C9A435C|nr:hypothetical protein [Clostridium botulinum]MBY6838781.1 hypothetical protein [Clostridium botulinum]